MPEDAAATAPEPYLAATAQLLGITPEDAWAASVAANLRILAAAAALLNEFPLSDTVEAAPRFEA